MLVAVTLAFLLASTPEPVTVSVPSPESSPLTTDRMPLLAAVVPLGPTDRQIGGVVFLLAFGWLTGLGLAKLYKIVAFLTWLECYGSLLGKRPTPRVQDLVDERRAMPWFWLYFMGVSAATLAVFLDAPLVFRVAAFAMLISTARICFELVLTRSLAAVPTAMLPDDCRAWPRVHLPIL